MWGVGGLAFYVLKSPKWKRELSETRIEMDDKQVATSSPQVANENMAYKHVTRSDGQKIGYKIIGPSDGTPILCIHSFLCHSEYMWGKVLDESKGLAGKYRIIAMDVRGHGESGPMTANAKDMYDLVDDAIAVLDDANVPKAVWMGLSIGGMISMRAAIKYPGRVEKLVLLNTDAHGAETFDKVQHVVLGKLFLPIFGWGIVAPTVKKQFFYKADKSTYNELRHLLKSQHTKSLIGILTPLDRRKDVIEELKAVQIPALIIHGENDKALRLSFAKDLAAALPDNKLVVLPKCGHISTLEHPEEIVNQVSEFLT